MKTLLSRLFSSFLGVSLVSIEKSFVIFPFEEFPLNVCLTSTNDSFMSLSPVTLQTKNKRRKTRQQTQCQICFSVARYSFFGAICCSSCKVFFKRHVQLDFEKLKCSFNGQCDVNSLTRHLCRFCRFRKCLNCGMSPELVRGSIGISKQKSKSSAKQQRKNLFRTTATFNILQVENPELTFDQWNFIRNLLRCYDEENLLNLVQTFVKQHKNFPPKLRYKPSSFEKLLAIVFDGFQSFFELNEDFRSLESNDRSILLRNSMENAAKFAGFCVFHHAKLFHDEQIFDLTEKIYGPVVLHYVQRLIDEIDHDWTFVKLCVSMITFSTTNSFIFDDFSIENIKDQQKLVQIQNNYAEITWRYLLCRYDHRSAVLRFTNYIRCFLLTIFTTIESHRIQRHKQMVQNLFEKLDRTLTK